MQKFKTLILRLACVVYDSLVLVALWIGAAALWMVIGVGLGRFHPNEPLIPGNIAFDLYILAVTYLYLAGLWHRTGQTLGMRAWRMRVTAVDGAPVGWKQGFVRLLAATLSWLLLGAGWLYILFDEQGRALHDRLSGTRVLRLPREQK